MSDATQAAVIPLEVEPLMAEAVRREGLSDFGSTWFTEPMDRLLKSMRDEAKLSPPGRIVQTERIVNGFINRLRLFDALKQHPEIADEQVHVAGVILGLSRSGSTMLHRLLGNAPGNTAVMWWETQNPAPFPGEPKGAPTARRAAGQQILDYMLETMPDLMSIHPMSLDQPDEEIIIMDETFMSTMAESYMWIPSFVAWLQDADMNKTYEELRLWLQFLQWQDPTRKGKIWFLKTPCHMTAPACVLKHFPEAKVLMTHRDPVRCIPSYCSMVTSIYTMTSAEIDLSAIGGHWSRRWSTALRRLFDLRARDPQADARFIDIQYTDLTSDPMKQVRRIYDGIGRTLTPETEAAMGVWLKNNARDNRPAHKYDLAKFGLSEDQLKRDFDFYRAKFWA